MKKHSEYFESVKENAVKSGFLTDELSDFYSKIFKFQEEHLEKFKDNDHGDFKAFSAELPYLDRDKFSFSEEDRKIIVSSFEKLEEIIRVAFKDINLDSLKDDILKKSDICEEYIKLFLDKKYEELSKVANDYKIGFEEFLFILINLVKPFFINLREQTFKEDLSEWFEPICPFCGSHAEMSAIIESKENAQVLHCGFCEQKWNYKRMSCTICKNDDHEKLGYYTVGDEEFYRIEYCDVCKGYIKTLRIGKQFEENKFDMVVENVITTFLDASAIDMGYKRP